MSHHVTGKIPAATVSLTASQRMNGVRPAAIVWLAWSFAASVWFIGFAFFLVDRLLAPGGWMVFDDMDWTFASSMRRAGSSAI